MTQQTLPQTNHPIPPAQPDLTAATAEVSTQLPPRPPFGPKPKQTPILDRNQLPADELAVMERKGFYIVSRRDGKPLTESGFNAIWRRHKARLALGPVQFHGLRKNATAALYEAGCTPQGVQGITGHKTLQMVQYYGRGARQERLARQAMGKWQKNTD